MDGRAHASGRSRSHLPRSACLTLRERDQRSLSNLVEFLPSRSCRCVHRETTCDSRQVLREFFWVLRVGKVARLDGITEAFGESAFPGGLALVEKLHDSNVFRRS